MTEYLDELVEEESGLVLRDYQSESVEQLRAGIRAGKKNQVLCIPTGGGKSCVAIHLLNECYKNEKRAIFIVERLTLIDQFSQMLDDWGLPHGVIQSGHWRRKPWERIQVASAQTLAKRSHPNVDLRIIDEAHVLMSDTVREIQKRDCVTIGLTATPFSKAMGVFYDGIVNVVTTNQLTTEGHLVPFKTFCASQPDMTGAKVVAGEWANKDASERSVRIVGDCVQEYKKHCNGGKFLAFGTDVAHCEALRKAFMESGIVAELYTYQTSDDEKKMRMDEFRKPGEESYIRGLISVSALSRGLDVPDCSNLIMARPLKASFAEHIQILGRVLRPYPGKEEAIILDHTGNMERFYGEMCELFENGWHELDDGKKKEKKKPKPGEKKATKCPKCFHVWGGGLTCPVCGFVFPPKVTVKHEPGELREWSGGQTAPRSEKERIYGELKHYARMKFWKPGWAAMKFRERFGVRPNAYSQAPEIPTSPETKEWIRKSIAHWVLKNRRAA